MMEKILTKNGTFRLFLLLLFVFSPKISKISNFPFTLFSLGY